MVSRSRRLFAIIVLNMAFFLWSFLILIPRIFPKRRSPVGGLMVIGFLTMLEYP